MKTKDGVEVRPGAMVWAITSIEEEPWRLQLTSVQQGVAVLVDPDGASIRFPVGDLVGRYYLREANAWREICQSALARAREAESRVKTLECPEPGAEQ